MSVLEDRYRSVLRMLPASYREVWQEEMVSTFLESMETDDVDEAEFRAQFGRPGVSEVASVAALAARLRFGGTDAPPRSFAWGEAVRRVALVGFLAYAAYATSSRWSACGSRAPSRGRHCPTTRRPGCIPRLPGSGPRSVSTPAWCGWERSLRWPSEGGVLRRCSPWWACSSRAAAQR